MNFLKKYLGLLVVIFLSIPSILSLFHPGFFPMHDDTQVARVFEIGKALRDGMFPVRWVADLGYGYGYPIFNFYAPLAYYFGGLLSILGFNALTSTKIMMGTGILLSGIFMYFFAQELFGKLGGVVSGLFYVYAPYHAVDVYVRGDVAEFWAYAFIPLMFLGFYKLISNLPPRSQTSKSKNLRWVIVGAIGFAGIVLSHNLTAMMIIPFLIIILLFYCFVAFRNKNLFTIYYLLFTIFLGLLLSAFYWLPALFEMKSTNVLSQIGGGANFRDHFVCWQQLWSSPWGFGGSTSGCIDGISFMVGKLYILMSTAAIVLATSLINKNLIRKKDNSKIFFILFSIFGLLVSVFLTLEISKPVWELIFPMAFLQYPWRFLLFTSFFTSVLAGALFWFLRILFYKFRHFNTIYYLSAVIVILALIYLNAKLFIPQIIINKNNNDYTNNVALKWIASKISDEYMPKNFNKPKSENQIVNNKILPAESSVKILYGVQDTKSLQAFIDVPKDTKVKINTAFFPAWTAFVDGKKAELYATNQGVNIFMSSGKHTFNMEFIETPIEKLANFISLTGLFILIIGIIPLKRSLYK